MLQFAAMRPAPALLVVLAALAAAPASAAKVSVFPFSGPGGPAAKAQVEELVGELADEVVPHSKLIKNKRVDWAKAKKLKVNYVVTGRVLKEFGAEKLELYVYKGPGKLALKKKFFSKRGKMGGLNFRNATSALSKTFKTSGRMVDDDAPPEETPAPDDDTDTDTESDPPVAKSPKKPLKEEATEVASSGTPDEAESPENTGGEAETESDKPRVEKTVEVETGSDGERLVVDKADEDLPDFGIDAVPDPDKPPTVTVEAGTDLFSRRFAFNQKQKQNLRGYSAFVVAPRVRAELYPLAGTKDISGGFGIEGAFLTAVGLRSRLGDQVFPTSLTRIDVLAKLRVRPNEKLNANVTPLLGFRSTTFSLAPAAGGVVLDGLPAVAYSAIQVGAEGEYRFAGGKVTPTARLTYLHVLSSGQISSAAFFPRSSVSGIDVQLGLTFKITKQLDARLASAITSYGFSFQTVETDTFQAAGAVDQYLTGNVSLRYAF
jgi:hypothetical protein